MGKQKQTRIAKYNKTEINSDGITYHYYREVAPLKNHRLIAIIYVIGSCIGPNVFVF